MISTPQEYYDLLARIQDSNRPTQAILIPKNEKIYDIDLNTRMINAPTFLSVEQDHRAERIFFKTDRYVDDIDLATKMCVIQYFNNDPTTSKRGYIYPVPYIDVETFKDENKILFEWNIQGPATAYAGIVEFAVQFYELENSLEPTDLNQPKKYIFNLNTLPAKSKVLHGMDIREVSDNYTFDASAIDEINARINALAAMKDLYWIDAY